jgi:threonine/homoserine/homoserine lactone efflux protein
MPPTILGFALAAVVIIAIPGPSVLFTIGRALSVGRREAFLSVVGNAFGILTQIVAIAVGLGPVVAASVTLYEVIRIGGALYLVWLGVQAFRHRSELAASLGGDLPSTGAARHSLRTGYLVGVTNPKTIVFFTALLPQFIDPTRAVWSQIVVLGIIFTILAICMDGTVAMLASQARAWFGRSPKRLGRIGAAGGVMMVGLGTTMLVTGRRVT